MAKLSATFVQKTKTAGRHADGKGLYLLVKPTGGKSWVLRIVVNGRRRDFGLGPADLVSLEDARAKAVEGRKLVRAGLDPSIEWKRVETVVPNFKKAATEYHGIVKGGWRNGKHGDQWLTTLETYAFPIIGERAVDAIDASAVQEVLLPIWMTKPETARRVRQRIFVILDYCKAKKWRETEAPARAVAQLMKGIKQPKGTNFAAMPYAELPALMARLRAEAPSVGRYALQFLILTAARSGEVRGATWREIDLDAAEWKIPAERMKAGKMHIVPLVPAAVEILKELRGLLGGQPDEPVFPGLRGKSLSDATLAKALRVAGGGRYTVHGNRSAFRDWAAESGFADAWAEAALAHGNPDKTEAAYRRTTYFADRRDKLMPAWARFALGDKSNVVALAERRA
jgi:integrase